MIRIRTQTLHQCYNDCLSPCLCVMKTQLMISWEKCMSWGERESTSAFVLTGFPLDSLWVPFIFLHAHSLADDHVTSSRWIAMEELQIGSYLAEWIPINLKAQFCNNFPGLNSKLSANYQFDMKINSFSLGKVWLTYFIWRGIVRVVDIKKRK